MYLPELFAYYGQVSRMVLLMLSAVDMLWFNGAVDALSFGL